jgi:hypothetical protein
MTLNANIQVPLPEKGIIVLRTQTGYPGVYHVLRTYRNKKGQPTNDRVLIGKLDRDTGMLIPNARYWEFHPDAPGLETLPARYSARSIGTAFLASNIMDNLGLGEALDETLGPERSREAQTAATYMLARGNVMEGVRDWCEESALLDRLLTSQSASALFASITYPERMSFFKGWVPKQRLGGYLAYDVTSFSTYAKGIEEAEWGYNRDGERIPQINLGCYLSEATGLPAYYTTYPGSITDKSHLPYMMASNDELGISGCDVGFVLDRGFCSTANIQHLAKEGHDFIIGVEKRHKATRAAIDSSRDRIRLMSNHIGDHVYAVSTKGTFYGVTSTMHVYHDPELESRQKDDMMREVAKMEAELGKLKRLTERDLKRYRAYFSIRLGEDEAPICRRDYGKIEAAAKDCGFFCILTNTALSSAETLDKYRRKDVIEKGFDDIKNHIDMKPMRTHNSKTTEGKMFCAFMIRRKKPPPFLDCDRQRRFRRPRGVQCSSSVS